MDYVMFAIFMVVAALIAWGGCNFGTAKVWSISP